MLPLSRKPQIIRLHELEQTQRNRYINQFSNVCQQWVPEKLWSLLPILADIYYTYTTICMCRRRLGQQYTYVAMYNAKHYEQQGVLVNQNTRLLMFVLQITQRHLIKYLMKKLWIKLQNVTQKDRKFDIIRNLVSLGVDGVLQQGRLIIFMLFLLNWSKYFNVVDILLKNQYIYTFKNKSNAKIDYRIQGYMLVCVLIVKFLRFLYSSYKIMTQKKKKKQGKGSRSDNQIIQNKQESDSQEQLCRICYDQIKSKSVTSCGHIFCWKCIIKYLNTRPECPVCRSACQPKQIIQLQNY